MKIKLKILVQKAVSTIIRPLYGSHPRFGDHVQFATTTKDTSFTNESHNKIILNKPKGRII